MNKCAEVQWVLIQAYHARHTPKYSVTVYSGWRHGHGIGYATMALVQNPT